MRRPATAEVVTIASLNMHCGVSGSGQPYDVEAAIRGLDAQVIALQEVWQAESGPDPVAAAADALGAVLFRAPPSGVTRLPSLLGVGSDTGPGRSGMAVLCTLPVLGYEVVALGRAPGDLVTRRAQILRIELSAGTVLQLAATHLTYRLVSPGQLWRLGRRLERTPMPTVIAGDLNMPRLLAGLAPGYALAVRGRTWPAELPMLQLDHVLASRAIESVAGAVLPAAGSDHLPVRAHVRVGRRPATS